MPSHCGWASLNQVCESHSCRLQPSTNDLSGKLWCWVAYAILDFFLIEICQKEGQVCHILELRHIEWKFNPLPKARFLFTLPWFCHCPPHFPSHTPARQQQQAAEVPAASGTKWQKLGLNLQFLWSLQLFLARLYWAPGQRAFFASWRNYLSWSKGANKHFYNNKMMEFRSSQYTFSQQQSLASWANLYIYFSLNSAISAEFSFGECIPFYALFPWLNKKKFFFHHVCFSRVNFPFHMVDDSGQPKCHDSLAGLWILVPKPERMCSPLSRGGHPPEGDSSGCLKETDKERTSQPSKENIIF